MKKWILLLLLALFLACQKTPQIKLTNRLKKENFVTTTDGKQTALYYLTNKNGLQMAVSNFGARVVALLAPDRNGINDDIVLGYDSIQGYLTSKEPYFGAAIGRFGNRIAKGQFTLDGTVYQLAQNNNGQSLHGGPKGFHNVVWDAEQPDPSTLLLRYLAKDGEEGFPGNLTVIMKYSLTADNGFRIEYSAQTDKATVINLTHHSFFNLHGAGNGTINDHELFINADRFTPVDSVLIPKGKPALVEGTAMDFRTATPIGYRLDADYDQFKMGNGYDHNYVLNRTKPNDLELAASVYEPQSGRFMEVWTTEPGLQFYGGNFLDGKAIGKGGKPYTFRTAFCLETQHFPNSPNRPDFPSVVLRPGENYQHVCVYQFKVK